MDSLVTVTAASDSYRLTTLSLLKAELGIVDPYSDGVLSRAILAASNSCTTYIRRTLACQDYTETFRPTESLEALSLSRMPIVSITSITEDDVALETIYFEFDDEAGLVYRLCSGMRTCWSACKIVVVYRAGFVLPEQTLIGNTSYSTRTLPHDIEQAAIIAAKARYLGAARDPSLGSYSIPGVISENFNGANAVSAGGLPEAAVALLGPYRSQSL